MSRVWNRITGKWGLQQNKSEFSDPIFWQLWNFEILFIENHEISSKIQGVKKKMDTLTYYSMLGGSFFSWNLVEYLKLYILIIFC